MRKLFIRQYHNGLCICQNKSISDGINVRRGFGWSPEEAYNDWRRLNWL